MNEQGKEEPVLNKEEEQGARRGEGGIRGK